jgi:hypothetical protein
LVTRFFENLQVVTASNYNTGADFHSTNHSTFIFSVYFHWSSLSVSWQRIYNAGTINVSLNHTLLISLYYSTQEVFNSHVKSSQADFYRKLNCIPILLTLCFLKFLSSYRCGSGTIHRKHTSRNCYPLFCDITTHA